VELASLRLRRRRTLPSGRAVIGGFLVSLSAIGVYVSVTASAGSPPEYVIAAHDLEVGQHIRQADIAIERMTLPPSLGNRFAFTDPATVLGAVVVNPVTGGELLQRSDLVAATGASDVREMSFPIESDRALDGQVLAGDRVDVVATVNSGESSGSVDVLEGAEVVAVANSGGGLSGGQSEVLTLALTSPAQVLALAEAVDTGQIFVVRASGDPSVRYPGGGLTVGGSGGEH
jgi:Flp pilus assembly protein CpaB